MAMIAEHNASNQLTRRYVHGPGVDEPLLWYEGAGTSDKRYLHADERGSIIAISNGAGSATIINSYDEYGIPGAARLPLTRLDPQPNPSIARRSARSGALWR